jgi:hypothetical protein
MPRALGLKDGAHRLFEYEALLRRLLRAAQGAASRALRFLNAQRAIRTVQGRRGGY